jgi:hypothetical protein
MFCPLSAIKGQNRHNFGFGLAGPTVGIKLIEIVMNPQSIACFVNRIVSSYFSAFSSDLGCYVEFYISSIKN